MEKPMLTMVVSVRIMYHSSLDSSVVEHLPKMGST